MKAQIAEMISWASIDVVDASIWQGTVSKF